MAEVRVHLGVPTYNGQLDEGLFPALFNAARSPMLANIQIQVQSWTTRCFNACLAAALNGRARGVTHFLLLHADLVPTQPDWFERMISIAEANKADVLSAIAPLKSDQGVTSTALDVFQPPYVVKRLTLHEVYKDFPPTFTHEKLLLNTGCMLIDLRKPWVEKLRFHFVDEIIKLPDGKFKEVGVSEDWQFSREARDLGATLYATREVTVSHRGGGKFGNDKAWGTVAEEVFNKPPLGVA